MSQVDHWPVRVGRRGRAGRGLPRPEPGAGSAGPGAAQRRRLISVRLNSAVLAGLETWGQPAYCAVSRLRRQLVIILSSCAYYAASPCLVHVWSVVSGC